MERHYPAIEIRWRCDPSPELIDCTIAALDEARPTAVEERGSEILVYFASTADRDQAVPLARLSAPDADVSALSVSDDAWAERSQASLGPVRVGRIVLTPPWVSAATRAGAGRDSSPDDIVVTIIPSMGFGTGHHASTRLCLALMQEIALDGRTVLDVGTGSGALALAAWRLGAKRVVAMDNDADALRSAAENIAENGAGNSIELRQHHMSDGQAPTDEHFDVITANLTGALLQRLAGSLAAWLGPGGRLVVSGLQDEEESAVLEAFRPASSLRRRVSEEGWVGLHLEMPKEPG